jgi:hypothetical protein
MASIPPTAIADPVISNIRAIKATVAIQSPIPDTAWAPSNRRKSVVRRSRLIGLRAEAVSLISLNLGGAFREPRQP